MLVSTYLLFLLLRREHQHLGGGVLQRSIEDSEMHSTPEKNIIHAQQQKLAISNALSSAHLDFELADYSRCVICDEQLVDMVDDHLVHAIGAQRGPGKLGKLLAGSDVAENRLFKARVVLHANRSFMSIFDTDFIQPRT